MPCSRATARIFSSGPTRIGAISPWSPASIAPTSAVASQGCATAVGTGSRPRHLASAASYFPVPEVRVMGSSCTDVLRPLNRRPGFVEQERQENGERDAGQQRCEGGLVV